MCNEMTAMMIECYKDVIALQVVCGENIQIRCDRQSDRRVRQRMTSTKAKYQNQHYHDYTVMYMHTDIKGKCQAKTVEKDFFAKEKLQIV